MLTAILNPFFCAHINYTLGCKKMKTKGKNRFSVLFAIMIATMIFNSISTADTTYFENVAPSSGVADTGSGNRAVWIDYDNDGDLDLHLVNNPGSGGTYRNNLREIGDANFTSVSIGLSGNGNALAIADYNCDGYMDVLIGGGSAILYRNKGDGTFEDVTAPSGISVSTPSEPIWGDYYNQDCYPDLYFGEPPTLYRNNGDGTFTDVTSEAFPSTPPNATPAWIDFDNDGYNDLFLSPGSGNTILYHNENDGNFVDVSASADINLPSEGGRLAVGDFNGDTWDDIYVFAGDSNNYLFSNDQDGTFSEVALSAGVQTTAGSDNYDVASFDFDLDGDLDLFADGGRYGSNNFFRNNNDGTFTDITSQTGLSNTDDAHDIVVGDFDADGYPDIYEVCFTGAGSSVNKLFLNKPRWILLNGQLNIPRQGLTGEALNGFVYAIAGVGTPYAQDTVSRYNPRSDTWYIVNSTPTARHSLSSAVIGDYIYVVGGHVVNSRSENERWDGDPCEAWQSKAAVYARSGPGVPAFKGELYVFGGNHYGTLLSRFDIYNPTTDTWRVGGDMPVATQPWRATTLDGKIYVNVGGDNKQIWCYDPFDSTWDTSIPLMNVSREFYELQTACGRIYAIGGYNASDGYLSSVESWTPGETNWRMEPSLNIARSQFASAVLGSDIFVFGGTDGNDLSSTELLRRCTDSIDGDINNNCKVDLFDLAIMASRWLECTLVRQNDCW